MMSDRVHKYSCKLGTLAAVIDVIVDTLGDKTKPVYSETVEEVVLKIAESCPVLIKHTLATVARYRNRDGNSSSTWYYETYFTCIDQCLLYTFFTQFSYSRPIPFSFMSKKTFGKAVKQSNIRGLILGCTHEPWRKKVIKNRYWILYMGYKNKNQTAVDLIIRNLFNGQPKCENANEVQNMCTYCIMALEVGDIDTFSGIIRADPSVKVSGVYHVENSNWLRIKLKTSTSKIFICPREVDVWFDGLTSWLINEKLMSLIYRKHLRTELDLQQKREETGVHNWFSAPLVKDFIAVNRKRVHNTEQQQTSCMRDHKARHCNGDVLL